MVAKGTQELYQIKVNTIHCKSKEKLLPENCKDICHNTVVLYVTVESNECSNNPCVNGACVDIGDTFRCDCNSDYTGTTCQSKLAQSWCF